MNDRAPLGAVLPALLLLVALVVSGCTSTVLGTAAPDPAVVAELERQRELERTPLTAELALGDFSTVDYCSVVDFAELGKTFTLTQDPITSFDSCSFAAELSGVAIQVDTGYLTLGGVRGVPESGEKLPRGLKKELLSERAGECSLFVVFVDDHRLEVRVRALADGTGQDPPSNDVLCQLADAVLDDVVSNLVRQGAVRHVSYPASSLGSVRLCGDPPIVDRDRVSSLVGIPVTGESAELGGHSCRWETDTSVLVVLYFGVEAPPQADPAGGVTERNIAGRPSFVHGGLGSDFCIVRMPAGPAVNGGDEVEIAGIIVQGQLDKPACAAAEGLAAAAWPKLPTG